MARGSSQSQSSTSTTATRPGIAAPRGSAAATAGMRRRRLAGGNSSTSASVGGGGGGNMLRFYTDDAPGLKISPTVVLVMSLCFIGFVTALHVFGKLYRSKSGGA
ncbi:protein transport protein Sec61 subunit beta-like [Vigna unguiculata]|uniref:Protein transport protein Sec61 subunit beta n=1 Tax=Vigna unguiculata TaxID=3917 RepID=A0A4D6N9Z5_VIGUN|nr:protein transport protein Sec61 subunit beta-like [Vigna unguiculata]QCE09319.1 protein transport protein SEC61 subunit beta [Vigna unguiculata]